MSNISGVIRAKRLCRNIAISRPSSRASRDDGLWGSDEFCINGRYMEHEVDI